MQKRTVGIRKCVFCDGVNVCEGECNLKVKDLEDEAIKGGMILIVEHIFIFYKRPLTVPLL